MPQINGNLSFKLAKSSTQEQIKKRPLRECGKYTSYQTNHLKDHENHLVEEIIKVIKIKSVILIWTNLMKILAQVNLAASNNIILYAPKPFKT